MDLLNGRISHTPISLPLRKSILSTLTSTILTESEWNSCYGFDSYFTDWFEDQCQAAAAHVSVDTHQQILDIVNQLRNPSLERQSIVSHIFRHQDATSNDKVQASIDLATRLWLLTAVGVLPQSITAGNTIRWSSGRLQENLQPLMIPARPACGQVRLPRIFTAVNLETIAGLRIKWTSNLADHLCLKEDDTAVCIFHQISFLELHLRSGDSPFSHEFIKETTRTLALLIPSSDRKAQRWFKRKQKQHSLDRRAGGYGPLDAASRQTDEFNAWNDRLVLLKQVFDDSEPKTIQSWWYDDRKKVQWYTFWLAALILLLTIVFGLIQSISGVIQAWAAVRSMPP